MVTAAQLEELLGVLHGRGYRLLELWEGGFKVLPVDGPAVETAKRVESAHDDDGETGEPSPQQDLEMLLKSSGGAGQLRLKTVPKVEPA